MRGDLSFVEWILQSPVTWFVTALNIGIFIIAEHHGSTTTVETLIAYGACERHLVQSGDYWRLASYMFLHIGWIHLALNTWSMVGWCAEIERTVGSFWFSLGYFTTGVAAGAISVICHDAVTAGASGAGFGMLAVIVALFYRRAGSWEAFRSHPHAGTMLANAAIWVIIGFSGMVPMDNFAHLGGFVFGVAVGLLMEMRRGKKRAAWMAGLAAYSLVWVGVVGAACIRGVGFHLGG